MGAYAGYERLFGMSHSLAKTSHALLMGLAALAGTLGIVDMWLLHATAAAAQEAKGWPVHFQ